MIQPIRFRGLSLAKDEQAVQTGELALCANVELHDGALRPSVLSGTAIKNRLTHDKAVSKLLYVHTTTSYTHYIALDSVSSRLVWYLRDGSTSASSVIDHAFSDGIDSIDSIGNTLVVIASDGIHYILWKNTINGYKYLGQKPPFLTISFDLSSNHSADYETGGVDVEGSAQGFYCAFQQTTISCNDAFTSVKHTAAYQKGDTQLRIKTKQQSEVSENVWALVNRTNSLIAKSGHFYANFFVRYCYRLYDGTMVMHSAPIFMPVLVPDNYLVYVVNAHQDSASSVGYADNISVQRRDSNGKLFSFTINKLTFMYVPRNVALLYSWSFDNSDVAALKEWSDIVVSIDFFVTPPVTRTDSSQTVKSCVFQPDFYYRDGIWEQVWAYGTDNPLESRTVVDFPGLSRSAYADKIANQSAFFRVCSMKTDNLAATALFDELPIDKSVLEHVSTQEQMRDDYKTHNTLFPRGMYVYNHRLNLYGLCERLFHGFNAYQLFSNYPYLAKDAAEWVINKIVTRLSTDNGYKFVEIPTVDIGRRRIDPYYLFNMPIFYPDARADRMYFYITNSANSEEHWVEFKLRSCNELNGAIHVGDFSKSYPYMSAPPTYAADDRVTMYNRIYTSEQDNPFHFPVEAINSVGTGDIVGLAATTRALSQGQFGQYPLMAFTSDGIWALQVSASGTYSSKQPISREVCVNPLSICQLDQSVVFATDRAINKVVESSVASFSNILDGPFFSVAKELPKLYDYFSSSGRLSNDILQLISFSIPPIEYFKHGRVINDFVNNRLIVFPATSEQAKEVVLVYSIRDDAWSTMVVDTPVAVINAYPYPYLQMPDGSVLVLDRNYDYTDANTRDGLVVSRTLSFDQAMLAVTGFDQQTNSAIRPTLFLFGSNDNSSWHYIGRSNRTLAEYLPVHPFRFFRVAIHTSMTQADMYFQLNLKLITKYEKL